MLWCGIYGFLKDWQTLIGALIALAAAIWTIRVIRGQAIEDSRRHESQLHRKEIAARAQMPDALSELIAYVRNVAKYLTKQIEVVPEEPTSAIAALKQVIEYIQDKEGQRIFELLSWYQVQRARMSAEDVEPARGEQFYDAVLLCAYTNSLFDYARNEESTAPIEAPSREEMKTALTNTFGLIYTSQNNQMSVCLNKIIARHHAGT